MLRSAVVMMVGLLTGYALGLVQGVRHAIEPDHVAAVSTVVAEQRSPFASVFFASLWGLGHTAMLVIVGGILLVFRQAMPEHVTLLFELGVAAMLIALGGRALRQAARTTQTTHVDRAHVSDGHPHAHGKVFHAHAGSGPHVHVRRWTLATRPLLIGTLHGLAGSGALTALVASSYPTVPAGLAFLVVYGLGAAFGMALLAGIAGVPLARIMRTSHGPRVVLGLAGSISVVTGLAWAWPILNGAF